MLSWQNGITSNKLYNLYFRMVDLRQRAIHRDLVRAHCVIQCTTFLHSSFTHFHTNSTLSGIDTQIGITLLVWWWNKKRLLPVGWANWSFHNVKLCTHIHFVKYGISQGVTQPWAGHLTHITISIQLLENRPNRSDNTNMFVVLCEVTDHRFFF